MIISVWAGGLTLASSNLRRLDCHLFYNNPQTTQGILWRSIMHALLLIGAAFFGQPAPATQPLWKDTIPGPVSTEAGNVPTLTVHLPAKGNGTAVVVCPGGGYSGRATGHEGKEIADWLNERGVTAFVLKYRTVNESNIKAPLEPGPMLDVQRAIRTVRAGAKEWKVDPGRIGVWGFSAGGHLASTAATHFDNGKPEAGDPIERVSSRPDFAILAYPVITMGKSTHGGSKNNLLGPNPSADKLEFYSSEKQVTPQTPPTFLFHTEEDKAVPIENSRLFKAACEKHGVPVKLVEYEKGQHGVGLGTKTNLPLREWPNQLEAWFRERQLLPSNKQ
jgi:acetyl esterase/lipase